MLTDLQLTLIRGKLGKDARALARGALDEIPQEVLDEGISQLSSAYAEKKDMKQAMADFFTGLPQLIATSGILGAGGEHIAQSAHNNAQTSQPQSQPQIPPNTTSNSTAPPLWFQPTTVNHRQQRSTIVNSAHRPPRSHV